MFGVMFTSSLVHVRTHGVFCLHILSSGKRTVFVEITRYYNEEGKLEYTEVIPY